MEGQENTDADELTKATEKTILAKKAEDTSKVEQLFDAIYTRFILRDLVARAIPGALIIFGVKTAVFGALSLDILLPHFGRYQTVFVLLGSWICMTCIQPIGHVTYLTRYAWEEKSQIWRIRIALFMRTSLADEKAQYERFIVMKEASGNTATALVVVLLALLYHGTWVHFYPGEDLRTPVGGVISFQNKSFYALCCLMCIFIECSRTMFHKQRYCQLTYIKCVGQVKTFVEPEDKVFKRAFQTFWHSSKLSEAQNIELEVQNIESRKMSQAWRICLLALAHVFFFALCLTSHK